MATDAIATEEVSNQRDSSDLNANKSNPESDTPSRTSEARENRNISSPLSLPSSSSSSSVHSEEELPQDSIAGNNSLEDGDRPVRTGDPPQEAATPDNRQKQGARTSTPARAPQTLSSPFQMCFIWVARPLPEEEDMHLDEELFTGSSGEGAPASQSYGLNSAKKTKRKLLAPDISLNLDHSEGSVLSDELDESTELDLDDIDTPSDNSNEFEWEDDLPKPKNADLLRKGVESVREFTSTEEREEGRRWRVFRIGEQEHRVDMKAIEPYKRVISHGGYYGDGLNAIIVFAVCFMPESNQPNYKYIMDNLFKYVIGTLELLVAENYMIVYLNGATSRRKMPSVGWLRKCYQQIDRRLRKNLKSLIIVHPSWFIRTLLALTKPFISSKFSQKIKYVFSLTDLAELVPMEYVSIPDCIKQIDQDVHGKVEMATSAVPE
uniref:BCL2/adenovirus E1B 19 kDa protein-interacting protein 2-like n=2 Tax=Sinocyclocheilus anshuiensis TaxID=1608454 RepID=A0A671T458_9TELE